MQARKYRPLRPNAQWMVIVANILGGDTTARDRGRATLWEDVAYYVEHVVRLPIGPLNEDPDARRDIAIRVLQKLEMSSSAHLARWHARQLGKREHASFWRLIKAMSWSIAIDYARGSRRNIGKRGQNFQWIRIDCADPQLLSEALGSPSGYLACGSEQEIDDALIRIRSRSEDDDGMLDPREPPPTSGDPADRRR